METSITARYQRLSTLNRTDHWRWSIQYNRNFLTERLILINVT